MSVNASEERLAALSRRTFLSMWSYQNPYYEKGKELCDVLVVFGDDVIIMSDKRANFSNDVPSNEAWARWYRRAVTKSVAQLRGAMKTIQARPELIYLDSKASSPFPLEIPENAHFHLMAIAHGSEEACRLERGSPSLVLDGGLGEGDKQFCVGIFFPELVHVLNREALDALFECFDTTADLMHYLHEKERLFRRNAGTRISSEKDLIALYMSSRLPSGEGSLPDVAEIGGIELPLASAGYWERWRNSSDLQDRRAKLASSYLIDDVIEQLAREYQAGAMLQGQDLPLDRHASAFSILASENRMARLLIGEALADVLSEDPSAFWSVAVESPKHSSVMYVWLIYPPPPDEILDNDVEHVVSQELGKYVFVAMGKFRKAQRFFGIAMPNAQSNRTSRIFRFAERKVWSEEMQLDAEALMKDEGILKDVESSVRRVIRAV